MNQSHRFAFWITPFSSVAAAMIVLTFSIPVIGQTPEKEAYKHGRLEAEKELKEGRATVYIYGLTSLFENLDQETGLLYSGFGCDVDESIRQRVKGHNDAIEAWIKAHGNPPNSFKPWEKEIFDPPGFFKTLLKNRETGAIER